MSVDDIIYLSLLLFSIGFGYIYRQINDTILKKYVGTLIGILIILIVSGYHIIHPLFTILINSLIILYVNKGYCHLVSFVFTFLYLLFFRNTILFGIPYPPAHTNLIQMILTLKLVGLAFEINSNYNQTIKRHLDSSDRILEEYEIIEPNFIDIVHYSLNYAGVLTGPYYRYRTFNDYFKLSYSKYANWKQATLDRLMYVPLFVVLFLWGSYNWPLSYATSMEFYTRSWLYRYWYICPNFFIFRMRIYTGLVLSECVCTMIGLGAYPVVMKPKPGQGPTENSQQLQKFDVDTLKQQQYDFETIRNIKPYSAEFCTTYREAMKHWNICVQYWLAVNIYKRFPNKKFRTLATVFVSAFWHGVYSGYYICIVSVPFVLLIEDIYVELCLKKLTGLSLKIYEWLHWLLRMHFFSYQAIAFLLLETKLIINYYNSIYHAGLILGVCLYIVGLQLLKMQKNQTKTL